MTESASDGIGSGRPVQVLQSLIDGEGVHFAAYAFSGFQTSFQEMAGDLNGKAVSNSFRRAFLCSVC